MARLRRRRRDDTAARDALLRWQRRPVLDVVDQEIEGPLILPVVAKSATASSTSDTPTRAALKMGDAATYRSCRQDRHAAKAGLVLS